jgi:hypothetical protein
MAFEPEPCPNQEGDGAFLALVGQEFGVGKPRGMATWSASHPIPRLLLWPRRSPMMRCPTPSMRPSFLVSMWIIDVDRLAGLLPVRSG